LKGTYPPLAGSAWLLKDPATPVRILLRGLGGPIEVSRAEYNGSMPSFDERLSDEHIAAVLTFARQQWGNDAAPVEAPFVTALRAQIERAAPWTAPELLAARATPIDWTPSDGAASGAETP
jgi:mono/diheme cytochrome c family protein